MEVCMVGRILPHFPILLYLTPLPPLYVTRAHTHSRLSMRPPPPRVEFLSLSLVSLLAHGVYIIGSDLYTIYIYIYIYICIKNPEGTHQCIRIHIPMYTHNLALVDSGVVNSSTNKQSTATTATTAR